MDTTDLCWNLLVGVAMVFEIVRTNSSTRVHVMAHRSVSSGAVSQSTGDQVSYSQWPMNVPPFLL